MSGTASTNGPSSSSSATPSQNPGNPESSALYLFTFLATLLLLLAVSCAIVVRSFILRRRLRRHMEEMIAAGVMMPGALDDFGGGRGRSRRRDFGEKPKLWEVWLDEQGQMHEGSSSDAEYEGKGDGKWEDILPVSVMVLPSAQDSKQGSGDDTNGRMGSGAISHRWAILSRIFSRRPELPLLSSRQSPEPVREADVDLNPVKEGVKEDEVLQVSVFISMPSPSGRRLQASDGGWSDMSPKGKERGPSSEEGDGEGELPDVVLGVAEVSYRG